MEVEMNIEENYDKIFRYCYYRIRDKQVAEDITQETFLRFLKSDYVNQQKEIRYLYVIARNLCIDESRKRKMYELPPDYEVSDEGECSEEMVGKMYMDSILAELTDEERDLLVLRYVNEESVGVICEELQISRFSLYRKLKSVTGKLKRQMEGGNGNE